MKRLWSFAVILGSAAVLGACAAAKPEDYGFRRVAITGQDYYCAPREWVLPPVVPLDAANDPVYPLYQQFLALPDTDLVTATRSPLRAACITQAQWPDWLTMRTLWTDNWALTPGVAESLAARRDVNEGALTLAAP
jgi:hypothetical protein